MKIAILLVEGAKQVMMTPENKHEKEALKMIDPDDSLLVVKKAWGTFGNNFDHVRYEVAKCQGGYFRPFEDRESLMFLIEETKKQDEKLGS